MALPAVKILHDRGMQIDWVCGRTVLPLLKYYSWLRVIPADDAAVLKGTLLQKISAMTGLWRTLAGSRYDLCATLYYDERYRLLSLPVRAANRLSLSPIERNNMIVPGRHHTDEYARLLIQAIDGPIDGYSPHSLPPLRPSVIANCPVQRGGSLPRVAIVPGGARNLMRDDALRRWPLDNYVRLAELLLSRGYEVLLVGSSDDHWVDSKFAALPVNNLIGKLSLPELVALFDQTDCVVTHDTGPLHLAGISNAGVVGIFGPTDPREKLPRREHSIAVWGGEGFACRPCYDGRNFAPCQHNGCMYQVTPQLVLLELDSLLERRSQGLPSPPRIVVPGIA